MIRIKLFVEGQTEETFVREVLAPAFYRRQIYMTPVVAQTSPGHKGGIVSYGQVKHQLQRLCKQDKSAYVSTLIDYYGLPTDFPGINKTTSNAKPDIYDKINRLEKTFAKDINQPNFIANFLLHEFEALLFCQPEKFADWLDDDSSIPELIDAKAQFPTPEHINNSVHTAPSKRILAAIPNYKKTLHGPMIAADIGLNEIRKQCVHFNRWLKRIEGLADE